MLDTFSIVCIVCSLIVLGVYYYMQYTKYRTEQSKLTWPRSVQKCPDYWIKSIDGTCKNIFNIGKCPQNEKGMLESQGTISFNSEIYKGVNETIEKCKWSKRCESSWEGIDHLCA